MRIRTILFAAAAPAALAAALLGTTGASAATAATAATHAATLTAATNANPNPGNGAVVIKTQAQAEQLMAQGGLINKNVDIPQGADVQLRWVDIKGNLSVEGKLSLTASQIEGNAEVSGPGAGLSLFNDPGNHFWRDLTVNGAGGYYDGSWINTGLGTYSDGQRVDGNLTFTNNTGSQLSLNGSMTVNGNFTYSGNALPYTTNGELTVGGQQSIS
jgi:hypothetical protein